eukprot:CAMPEP_0118705112 /NCGR_PEP_ID=MMETSP0800-20121206/19666_1 /TAXON_ID=210618 ORGANISM="Striatella unipunctata, Strain CCMP2910" /NCGR_SAMPLE_ID=MMETSP0800 /ASSEMBLY_ACC=CAM_ASM_000638 /LENGTH=170 /DNA_ID=CAMNT_0006607189 /DNA_START=165 /DNA_END=674 /DNA_ORIENTATION=-
MYWLYRGNVTASYEGVQAWSIDRTHGKAISDPNAVGLLGDMRFLYNLERSEQNNANKQNTFWADLMTPPQPIQTITPSSFHSKYPMATIKVGEQGATMLRIDSTKLLDFMRNDEQLAGSIRTLLLKSLQRKVGRLLREQAALDANQEIETEATTTTIEEMLPANQVMRSA